MVTLLILDGYGIGKDYEGNAIIHNSKNIDALKAQYPSAQLFASGEQVGLTAGQMGNSETGHLNIGLGRVARQDISRIDNDIKTGVLGENETIKNAIKFLKKNSSKIHFFGLLSDGGVHSHINHLKYLLKIFNGNKCNIVLHIILDGRDVEFNSANKFIEDIETFIKENKINAEIADVVGRVYAMDREKRFDRVKLAYDLYVGNENEKVNYTENLNEKIKESYAKNIYDEFVLPIKISGTSVVEDNDVLFFYNFRTDRMREIVSVFGSDNFNEFERKKINNLKIITMTQYDDDFDFAEVVIKPENFKNCLSEVLSKNGLKQFRVTETTKYAHITYFFNGGVEASYFGEERKLVESINVQDFSIVPKMKAKEITNLACNAIKQQKYDFVLINLSNADMVGHSGDLKATEKAIRFIDACTKKIANCCLKNNCDLIITADHGNAETMLDEKGIKVTSHTTNMVPFILVSEKFKNYQLKNGALCDIAPTILQILNIKKPREMTGKSLIKENV